ncbi:MAG: DUF465 domain-containing protein [Pseudomonadota bacterium]
MSLEGHLEALERKHLKLEEQISSAFGRPAPDQTALSQMKREKLKIKEEIERIRVHTAH